MHPPAFHAFCETYNIPPWAADALTRKWEAGHLTHKGGPGDFHQEGFDFGLAIAGELLDILNYADEALRQGAISENLADAIIIPAVVSLTALGPDAVHRAAEEAFDFATRLRQSPTPETDAVIAAAATTDTEHTECTGDA